MAVSLKNNLSPDNVSQSHMQLLWLEKLESDIYTTTTLNYDQEKDAQTRFDVAKLCQQLVILEKSFAIVIQFHSLLNLKISVKKISNL
jgi:hypothetical protein